jgi:hypothetical protein
MPMIEIKDKEGNVRWISVFPFNSLESAQLYVKNSSVPLDIVKGAGSVYWVCSPEDAQWALKCGYEGINND